MPKKKEALPSVVFIVKRHDEAVATDPFLIVDEGHDGFEDGEVVGKYKLVSTGVKRIEHRLEDK